jgi:carboxyl-terminal processing protease
MTDIPARPAEPTGNPPLGEPGTGQSTTGQVPDVPPPDVPSVRRRGPGALTWIALAAVLVLAGTALLIAGLTLGRQTALSPGTPADLQGQFQPFWDAYHAIEQRYAGGPVDEGKLVEGAIDGMFKSLDDPYSSYMNAEDYRKSLSGLSGQFEGIGATLTTLDATGAEGCSPAGPACRATVVRPLPGSPAEKAGVRAGDVIVAVDGASVEGKTVDEVVKLVRGPRGTQVTLTLQRDGGSPFDLTITRDVITSVDVSTRLLANGEVGYLRIGSFSANVARDFAEQLRDLVGEKNVRKIIVDVRDDPGGFVDQARTIASQFVASGPILWQETAGPVQTPLDAEPGGAATDPSIEVVVLVNKGTASASEIVAGALQDTGRARLVGERTFGKGTIQEWQVLGGEAGGFRLTVAKWLTPAKRWINGEGLAPDVTVSAADLAGAAPGADPALDKAVELLTGASAMGRLLPLAA